MTTIRRACVCLWMITLPILAIGCSKKNSPTASGGPGLPGGPVASARIGAAGGTVESVDDGVALVFPAGAVAVDTVITIRVNTTAPSGVIGRAFEFEPNGLTFAQPVTLRRSFDASELGSIVQAEDLWIVTSESGEWIPVFSEVDPDGEGGGTVTAELMHFSAYALRGPVVPTGNPDDVISGNFLTGCDLTYDSPTSDMSVGSSMTDPLIPCSGACNVAAAPSNGQGVSLDPGRLDVWGGTMERVDIVVANRGGEIRVLARTWDRELYRVVPATAVGVQTIHLLGGSSPIYMLTIEACQADVQAIQMWGNVQD